MKMITQLLNGKELTSEPQLDTPVCSNIDCKTDLILIKNEDEEDIWSYWFWCPNCSETTFAYKKNNRWWIC